MGFLPFLLFITAGFISGGIMFSRIIPKLFSHKDVCELSDDGNPGAFNVFAHCGKAAGCVCLALDVLKGFVPVLLASLFLDASNPAFALVMAAPVLGHALGLFNGFRGGKCISTSFGVMFGIIPVTVFGIIFLAVLYIFFSGIVRIKPNKKCSIIVYSLFLALSVTFFNVTGLYAVALGCAVISGTAIVKHVRAAESAVGERENERRDY